MVDVTEEVKLRELQSRIAALNQVQFKLISNSIDTISEKATFLQGVNSLLNKVMSSIETDSQGIDMV